MFNTNTVKFCEQWHILLPICNRWFLFHFKYKYIRCVEIRMQVLTSKKICRYINIYKLTEFVW